MKIKKNVAHRFTKTQLAAMAKLFYELIMDENEDGIYSSRWEGETPLNSQMAKFLVDNKFATFCPGGIEATNLLLEIYPSLC